MKFNRIMFTIASWALLALAWAWFTLEWVPRHGVAHYLMDGKYLSGREYSSNQQLELLESLVGGRNRRNQASDEAIFVEPNSVLEFMRDHRYYFCVGGILLAVWCSSLLGKLSVPSKSRGFVLGMAMNSGKQ